MFTAAIVPLALAASALANVFITSPTSTTTFTAGQNATVKWQDSGSAPTLVQFGLGNIAIYAGNADEQTLLQTLATYVNVSTVSEITFTPDGTIGPNGNEYFIRFNSLSDTNGSSPAEAFSAMFTLAGMTGTFNSTIQAEINGQSTAPIGGTPTGSPSTASGASATGMTMSMSGMSMSSAPTSTATSTSTNGATKPVLATGLVALVATVIGASFL
ncbi:hypothetical protein V8E55_002814 [Tylopilus felleus]|jgi:hypothetical protein